MLQDLCALNLGWVAGGVGRGKGGLVRVLGFPVLLQGPVQLKDRSGSLLVLPAWMSGLENDGMEGVVC